MSKLNGYRVVESVLSELSSGTLMKAAVQAERAGKMKQAKKLMGGSLARSAKTSLLNYIK